MKTMFSEAYYREMWDRCMEEFGRTADLEGDLERQMKPFAELPEKAQEVIRKMEAAKIAKSCTADMVEKMRIVQAINSGKASLGYTTHHQEIEARGRLVREFEFTCLCLSDFRKKYGV